MAHSILGPSSAHRWMSCPPSVLLGKDVPDKTSEYAQEGSLAHELCEVKLKKQIFNTPTRTFNKQIKDIKASQLYAAEMQGYTDEYVEFIMEQVCACENEPLISIEEKVEFEEYVPGGFGTADCILITGDTIHVVDFKYGKGVEVHPENNPQMMLYALGAYLAYGVIYEIKRVKMSIVQPRISNIDTWECSLDELLEFGENAKAKAKQALAGEGEFSVGEHCRFCPVAATCRARAEHNLELAKYEFKEASLLGIDEVGAILKQAQDLEKWANQLKEWALSEALSGKSVPGWKAVNGRSSRVFTDTDLAVKTLVDSGVAEEILWERKLLTLAQMEKVIGKKAFTEAVGDLVESKPGKPTLVVETDKRPAISGVISAQEEFGNLED